MQRTKTPLDSPALTPPHSIPPLTDAQRKRLNDAIFGQRLENTPEHEDYSFIKA